MSSKNNAEVVIDGKVYTLSGYETEEYLQKVASYINNKISEYKKDESYRKQSLDVQKSLLELNIADDYFKAKKQADLLEVEIEDKDKQLYDLKHELVSLKLKSDDDDKKISKLQAEIKQLKNKL